jgi:hypothetical protein
MTKLLVRHREDVVVGTRTSEEDLFVDRGYPTFKSATVWKHSVETVLVTIPVLRILISKFEYINDDLGEKSGRMSAL